MRYVLVALALVLTGCGPARSGSLGPAPTGAPRSSAPASAGAPSPSTQKITVQVWFSRGGKVFPTQRTRPLTTATSRLALTELVAGPTGDEASAGVGSGVPGETVFDLKGISDGTATVSFPAAFYAGGRDAVRLREAQVVYTLTQFPTVTRVGLQSGGQPVSAPVTRADFADLLPAIVVFGPVIGQRVTSPVEVSGYATVFEAHVSLRVLDAAGRELATRFTLASCSCGGDYRTTLAYKSTGEQRGTVQVFEVSMRDGSHVNVVDIPVVLALG